MYVMSRVEGASGAVNKKVTHLLYKAKHRHRNIIWIPMNLQKESEQLL